MYIKAYICLACDREIAPADFPAHAAQHGWFLCETRQHAGEWDRETRVSTCEFGYPGGHALFWAIAQLEPLKEEADD
jgi:hypothetical protein